MVLWLSGHSVLTWALAWGLTGSGLFVADVWSQPRRGPLWVGLLFGSVAWGLAGGTTFRLSRIWTGIIVWAGAYGLAFWLGGVWGDWFEHNQVGGIGSAGFVGTLLGWAAGAERGALTTALLAQPPRRILPSLTFATAWGLSFLVASYIGLVAGMILGQMSKTALGFLGSQRMALAIGWGVGAALGGLLASASGLAAWRALFHHPHL